MEAYSGSQRLVGLFEGARELGVSGHTLRAYARLGLIKTTQIGRRRLISADELDRIAREGVHRPSRPSRPVEPQAGSVEGKV